MDESLNLTQSYNVPTNNKFDTLTNISNYVDTDGVADEEFVTQLRNRNSGREDEKRTRLAQEDSSQKDNDTMMARGSQRSPEATSARWKEGSSQTKGNQLESAKKEERSPPLNILYQSPKDTEKLIVN